MKNAFLFLSLLIFSALSAESTACSIFTNRDAKFHWSLFNGGRQLPTQPTVEVRNIVRAGDMGEMCNDVAILFLTIPVDTSNPAFAYKFEFVSGSPEPIFSDNPVFAVFQDGKQTFTFRWIERKALPLGIVVKVTAYTRSGKKGGSTNIEISDPGR